MMHLKIGKINLFIDRANATFRTLCIQSFATCFGCFWPPSGRFYNMHGKKYRGGGLPCTVKKMEKKLPKPAPYECPQSV